MNISGEFCISVFVLKDIFLLIKKRPDTIPVSGLLFSIYKINKINSDVRKCPNFVRCRAGDRCKITCLSS